MRSFLVYTMIFVFTWLSTGRGIIIPSTRLYADDDIDEAELEKQLEDEVDEEDENEEDVSDTSDTAIEDDTADSSDEGDSTDVAPEDEEDDTALSSDDVEADIISSGMTNGSGKSIAYIALFPDSYALKHAKAVAKETALYLADSDFSYFSFEADLFQSHGAFEKAKSRGMRRFEEAKKLFADFNMEEAIPKFKSAESIMSKHVDKMADLSLLSEILLYLGASYKMLDEEESARPYLLRYISMNPDKDIDEDKFAPEIVDYFHKLKDDFLMMPNGSLVFKTNPAGAQVFLDGKLAGLTPLRVVGVTAGKHYYRLHMVGYRDKGGVTEVEERDKTTIDKDLSVYPQVSFLSDAKEAMIDEFGKLFMLKKAVDVGKAFGVDRLLVSYASVTDGVVTLKYRLFKPETRSFKAVDTEFVLPEDGAIVSVKKFHKALDDLFADDTGYTPLTSVIDEASTEKLLGLDDESMSKKKKEKKKGGVARKWWFWTIIGVAVAGAAVGTGLALGLDSGSGSSSGAKLKLTFGK